MNEIVKIRLDNEMDLILAHKRTMKIAEFCGLSASAQTSFATAVSEIARSSISFGRESHLKIYIGAYEGSKKNIIVIVSDLIDLKSENSEAFVYVSRLLGNFTYEQKDGYYQTTLSQPIPYPGLISDAKISSFADYFKYEAPLSPYDEIRKKNIQLLEVSEKLAASEKRYKQLTDTLPLLIFSLNNKNEITFSNQGMLDFSGSQFTSFTSSSLRTIMHPDDCDRLDEAWKLSRKNKTNFKGQARLNYNGEYVWHLLSIVPQTIQDGEVTNWTGFFVDIHAQKLVEETLKDNRALREAQDKLQEYNKELAQKNKELEHFAYIASHDLQEPLRKIKFFISMADKIISPAQRTELFFDKISASAARMSNLIRDILNYSKVSATVDQFEPVDMNEILKDVLLDFDYTITEKHAAITSDRLPVVKGIPVQMNQMLYNLISNSLKFSVEKPVISINYEKLSGDSHLKPELPSRKAGYHKISLIDNGIGIEEKYSKKIFTIFQRLHDKSEYEGTGIGLALCKRIAENHNGLIEFSSSPGNGSTFDIYIPE